MDRNGQARKEPSLADLEAFEKLLRDSLQVEPPKAPPAPEPQRVSASADGLAGAPASAEAPQVSRRDHAAMAELARLIEAPLEFAPPPRPQPALETHTHGHAEAQLQPQWMPEPRVETHFSEPVPNPAPVAAPLDPLAAFEEELRRFDAIRNRTPETEAPPEFRPTYSGEMQPVAQNDVYADGFGALPQEPAHPARIEPTFHVSPPERVESPLEAAEGRLAAEAAAAAAASGAAESKPGISRKLFYVLGGVAAVGLAVIGSSIFGGAGSKKGAGDVPVIAAKPQPAKEKPADPGGVEIPNQNKQVLAPRGTTETKPAQVVNNTEQPLDLNQVTRRDGVRIIAPSPYQQGGSQAQGAAETNAGGGLVEPRRVTSIRIPAGGPVPETPPVAAPPSVSAPAIATGAVPLPPLAPSAPRVAPPTPAPSTPPASTAPRQDTIGAQPPKAETRPVPATPPKAEAPKVTPPSGAAPAPSTQPKAAPPRQQANAPLSLTNPGSGTAAQPGAPAATRPSPTSGGGGYAVQLASRPTEEDARNASNQLRTKFASALGGKALSVVSGEANGNTVYRVRAGGFSQAEAVEACNKVKAAGGGCFVTKQ